MPEYGAGPSHIRDHVARVKPTSCGRRRAGYLKAGIATIGFAAFSWLEGARGARWLSHISHLQNHGGNRDEILSVIAMSNRVDALARRKR
jgi:hypothetical protein